MGQEPEMSGGTKAVAGLAHHAALFRERGTG